MKFILSATLLALFVFVNPSSAADKSKAMGKMPMMEMTAAQREDMAKVHENAAACLRSDKPIHECHKEMMASCQSKMGKAGCPMMGHMHGKMHDHGEMNEENSEHEHSK
jgi:hypothetical protein